MKTFGNALSIASLVAFACLLVIGFPKLFPRFQTWVIQNEASIDWLDDNVVLFCAVHMKNEARKNICKVQMRNSKGEYQHFCYMNAPDGRGGISVDCKHFEFLRAMADEDWKNR